MIGIIPCGGKATRLYGLPKYLLPTPHGTLIDVLIDRMRQANPRRVVIMSKGRNTNLLHYTGHRDADIIHGHDQSMAHAVMLAKELAHHDEIAIFGMPDTFFEDKQAFIKLLIPLATNSTVDITLGLFWLRPGQYQKLGCVNLNGDRVIEVVDKPTESYFLWAWGVLAWRPTLWAYMSADDPHVGYALPRAIAGGLNIQAVKMDGNYFDCGTYAEYADCIRSFAQPSALDHA